MASTGVPVLSLILVISLLTSNVLAAKQYVTKYAEGSAINLPDAPSAAIEKGMQVLLTVCDYAESYNLKYILNGFFVVKNFISGSSSDDDGKKPCKKCGFGGKTSVDKSTWKDKLYSTLSKGITTQEGVALLTFFGSSVCEMAESYRKK